MEIKFKQSPASEARWTFSKNLLGLIKDLKSLHNKFCFKMF